jgi:enoyl-[acyl-carrier protein] reductase I
MLPIDLSGKRALVAGVSDDGGFGFAIAKSLAAAGATICLGSWPPALGIFTKLLERGKMEDSMRLEDGRKLEFERIYPLDAAFDSLDEAPAEIRDNKRYKDVGDFSIQGMASRLRADFGESSLDVVVHSLANAPEVKSPLVDTSRQGYLSAISVSAYSNVSLVRHLAPLMGEGGSFLSLNAISAGPWASRAASAIGFIDMMIKYTSDNSPLPRPIDASDVGSTAAFLSSPLGRAITGSVVYVDNGYHAMGMAVNPES